MCSVARIRSLNFENLQNENDYLSHLKKSKFKNRALSGPRGLFIVPIAQFFFPEMYSVARILSLSFEYLQNKNDFLSHLKKSKIKNRALSGPRSLFMVHILSLIHI